VARERREARAGKKRGGEGEYGEGRRERKEGEGPASFTPSFALGSK